MEESVISLLEEIFRKQIVEDAEILKILSSNKMIDTLFNLLDLELLTFSDDTSREIFISVWSYLYEKLKQEELNSLNSSFYKLKNLRKKFVNMSDTFKRGNAKEFLKIEKEFDNILDIILYKNVEEVITSIRNLNSVQKLLSNHQSYIYLKDEKGMSLCNNIFDRCLHLIFEPEFNEHDFLYYQGVLLIIRSISQEEKNTYLIKVEHAIHRLDRKDKEYKNKIQKLRDLCESVTNISNRYGNRFTSLAKKYHINTSFSNKDQNELKKYINQKQKKGRIYVDDYTITIDDQSSTEIDDALTLKRLSNGNYLLGVHITNVLGYLPYNSNLVENAIRGGRNLYTKWEFANSSHPKKKIVTLFPLEFSSLEGSLLQSKNTFTNSYYFELDKQANIVDSYFLKTIVRNDYQCNYNQIDQVLRKGCKNKKLERIVHGLDEIVYQLEQNKYLSKRLKKGKEEGYKYSRARRIVEIVTRLVNSEIANYFYVNQYPFLYRVHEKEGELKKNIDILRKEDNRKESAFTLNQLLNSSVTRVDLKGYHDCLNGIPYCHGTSPLRRSEDIVVEHCLDVCYFSKSSDRVLYQLEEDVLEKRDIINLQNQRISLFQLESSCDDNSKIKQKKIKN